MGLVRMLKTLGAVRHLSTGGSLRQAVSDLSVPVPWGIIRGKVWGPDHGRPVLCLHGWSDNCGSFDTLIPQLPKEWSRVVQALQWKRFSIIGHSMGGNVAAMFCAAYPEMVESFVLLDSLGFFPLEAEKMPGILRKGIDEMIEFEKSNGVRKEKVYTYEKAVERLMAANPSLSEKSARILLERGSSEVEGGVMFNRDYRINLTNIVRISLEQSLELQSRIQARIMLLLSDNGLYQQYRELLMTNKILKSFTDRGARVVNVAGDHHVHLNRPEVVAKIISDFLQEEALAHSSGPDVSTDMAKL
ncbi:hypothetical protein GJAV_G00143600 [Gymnothorax javanicus]|nr:hypothetical protein GJAV_G00143600 [Gymnothorax javanicus]